MNSDCISKHRDVTERITDSELLLTAVKNKVKK